MTRNLTTPEHRVLYRALTSLDRVDELIRDHGGLPRSSDQHVLGELLDMLAADEITITKEP